MKISVSCGLLLISIRPGFLSFVTWAIEVPIIDIYLSIGKVKSANYYFIYKPQGNGIRNTNVE
jgi:hypothetical protein